MAKAAMKSMKRSMKKKASSMKKRGMKKAKKVSIIAKGKSAKAQVFRGSKEKTVGGLKKSDLIRNKYGKVVSKKSSLRAKKAGNLSKWGAAVKKARAALKVKGFQAVGGKTTVGKQLLAKTRSFLQK